MNIAVIDFVFAGVIVLFVLRCVVRGFVSEVVSLASLVLGALTAIFFFRALAGVIRENFMPDMAHVPEIIAFVALFLVVFIVARILEAMLKNVIRGLGLDGLDRFLGAVLGFAEGVVVVCLLLFLINIQPLFDSGPVLRNSFFADLLMPFIMGRNWEFNLPAMIAGAREIRGGINLCLKTL